jgi:hypothetical protein
MTPSRHGLPGPGGFFMRGSPARHSSAQWPHDTD